MELTLYFLRLAPWIVRPASPSARAGTMMAAIRTKFEVASDWTVVGITAAYLLTAPSQQLADMPAPPPPNKAGGCWKELPKTLAKKRPCPLPRNRRAQQASALKGHKLLWLLLLLQPVRPQGLLPHEDEDLHLRSSKASMSLKPTGRSVGRPEKSTPASARAGCQPVLPRPPAARPERHAASPAQRPLQPDPQLPGAGQQTLGATPPTPEAARSTSARGAWPASPRRPWQRRRATQCYR